jgi:apolipoprotein D and lipocalin family protein
MAAQEHPSTPAFHKNVSAHDGFLRATSAGIVAVSALLALSGCATKLGHIPTGLETAKNFDPLRFEGTWHEIVRTNNKEEAGITRVTTTFKRKQDGSWLLTDRGWKNELGGYVESTRTASTGGSPGSFNVKDGAPKFFVVIDQEHTLALACSTSYRHFWILSKNPDPESSRLERMMSLASEAGFPVKESFFVPVR